MPNNWFLLCRVGQLPALFMEGSTANVACLVVPRVSCTPWRVSLLPPPRAERGRYAILIRNSKAMDEPEVGAK